MSIVAKENISEYSTAPEGLWPAVCCDVIDLGIVDSQWGESHQIEIRWQLEDNDPKTERPFMVLRRYRLSLHEKSNLRPMLEAWRGRKFNEEELTGFDLEKLVGVNCQVQVIHGIKSTGGTFAKVQAVVGPAKGTAKLAVRNYQRVIDRPKQQGTDSHSDADESAPF